MDEKQIVKRIIVASPADVSNERKRVDEVVNELNDSIGNILKFRFDVIRWETHAHPSMGRPQQVINKQLSIEKCDLFIGIVWKNLELRQAEPVKMALNMSLVQRKSSTSHIIHGKTQKNLI